MKWTPRLLKYGLRLYGPYLGAGVKVTHVGDDWRHLHVVMKMHWYNRNAFGVHFGGSLYAMVDPHLVLLLTQILGNGYIVWDQSATIDFVSPGKGTVSSRITISDEAIADIQHHTADGKKYYPEFEVIVKDANNNIVARVKKVLYVRKRLSR